MKQGHLFIISAPAGTGKTTLAQMLCDEFPNVVRSISCTTRDPRPQEVDGKDYFFITKEEFEKKLEEGEFLEHAKVFDHYYGTSKEYVNSLQQEGKSVLLIIDTQGAMQLKGKVDATYIFIAPPSIDELRARMTKRNSETPETLEKRISWAAKELSIAPKYDYTVINDDLNTAYSQLREIILKKI